MLLGLLAVGSFISWWITDMAVAAMLLPLGVGLLRDAGLGRAQSNFGRALMIAAAFGPLIGGIATPAGTAANLVAIAQLKQLAGVEISFLALDGLRRAGALLMVPLAWRLLLWLFPPELRQLPIQDDEVRSAAGRPGAAQPIERRTLSISCAVIAMWLFGPVLGAWTRRPDRPAG